MGLLVLAALTPLRAMAQAGTPSTPAAQATTPDETIDASKMQTGAGNNGIINSLQQCASLPHACQLIAPSLYDKSEKYKWEFLNYSGQTAGPQFGSPQSARLVDQRFGGQYETVLNPYTSDPGSGDLFGGHGNVFTGDQHKFFYGLNPPGVSRNQNYTGELFDCVHTQGGSLSQIYDNVAQSLLTCVSVVGDRSTSEAGFAINARYQATSPGDAVLYGGSLLGPAGNNHPFDEGLELGSQVVSESINVYRGQVATASSSQSLTITPAGSAGSETIAGTQGDGRYLLITSAGVTPLTPADIKSYAGQIIGGANFSYFSSVATPSGVPVSNATGVLTSPVTAPYGSEKVTVTANSGSLSNGIACIADQRNTGQYGQESLGNFEEVNITNAGSGSLTAVFHKSHPVGATYWQGGLCGQFIELVADTLPTGTAWNNGEYGGTTRYPVRYPYPVLGSLDGTHLIVFTAFNNFKQNNVAFGSAWHHASDKTANLYHGAEVYSVAGANDDLTDNVFTLAPNNASFSTGESVEESHFYSQAVSDGYFTFSQWSPSGDISGPHFQLMGRVEAPAVGVTTMNYNKWTSYTDGGGTWQLPISAYVAGGAWMYGFFWEPFNSGPGSIYDLLGAYAPKPNTALGLIGFPSDTGKSADQFTYTSPASGQPSGGTWGFAGNVSATGGIALSTVINTNPRVALTAANKNVIANAAGGAQTIALPSCTAQSGNAVGTGQEYTIIKSDNSPNPVTLQAAGAQTIDYNGQVGRTLAIASAGARTLVCAPDSNWYAH
jgi:hypothetical protein